MGHFQLSLYCNFLFLKKLLHFFQSVLPKLIQIHIMHTALILQIFYRKRGGGALLKSLMRDSGLLAV